MATIAPFNYTLPGVQSPFQALAQGMQFGTQMATAEAQRQEAERRSALAQAQVAAQQQALERQQMLARAFDRLTERVRAGTATATDFQEFALQAPKDQAETAIKFFNEQSAERKAAELGHLSQVASALGSKSPQIGVRLLRERAEAFRNSGDVEAARRYDVWSEIAEVDPADAQAAVLAGAAFLPGGDKVVTAWQTSREEARKRELQPLVVEAEKRKNIPTSILEAIDFDNLKPDQQKTFRNLQALKNPPAVTNVPVTVIEKGAAGELGKLVPDLYEQASAAAGQLQDIPRYREAAKRAITGPMAEQRLTAERIKNILGLTGDKALAATAELMQGQAEMALKSRSLMTGQGAITEGEQRLLVRARAGDLTMTGAEFNTLLDVFERAGRAQYDKSTRLLRSAATKSDTAKMFLDNVPQLPPAPGAGAPTGAGVTVTLPSGQVATFPNQQAADMFKRAAGIP